MDEAAVDLQVVSVTLLHMCGSFCRMVHIARVSLVSNALRTFDEGVKQCFRMCSALNGTDAGTAWTKIGGLGLRFLSHHDAIASVLSFSGFSCADNIGNCSIQIPWSRSPMPSLLRDSPTPQKVLSGIMIQA